MSSEYKDCGRAFSEELLRIAHQDPNVFMVNNDSVSTHYATQYQEEIPERLIDVGIAEQNMVGVACGLANSGKIPFVYSAGCFLATRAMEQIKADIAYTNANVKLCSFVSGMAYGPLGGTHHSLEDLAWMRAIPNLTVICTADQIETKALLKAGYEYEGPVYYRITSKTLVPDISWSDQTFEIGKAKNLRSGDDILLIGTGSMTYKLSNIANMLADKGISAEVLHIATLSPLDEDAILQSCAGKRLIVTAEEHSIIGGLGSAVAEVITENNPLPMLKIGTPNKYSPIAPADWLFEFHGLTEDKMMERIIGKLEQL